MNKLKRWWRVRCIRFVSWLRPNKLEAWSAREQMLMDQWWAALEHENYEECERLRELIINNWRQYHEAS